MDDDTKRLLDTMRRRVRGGLVTTAVGAVALTGAITTYLHLTGTDDKATTHGTTQGTTDSGASSSSGSTSSGSGVSGTDQQAAPDAGSSAS